MSEQAPPTAPPVDQPSVLSNAASVVKEKTLSAVSTATEAVREATASYGLAILMAIVVAVILFFIAYWLYLYLSTRLTNKLTLLVSDTREPKKGIQVTEMKADMPALANGKRVTYTFWIYIHDINKFSGSEMRHVLHFGDERLQGASPAVYLDGTVNKLYVRFDKPTDAALSFEQRLAALTATNSSVQEKTAAGFASTATVSREDAIKIDLATRGIVIDYIPLQRWVHVAIVVNETVNRGYMSAYLDGELVKVIGSNNKITLSNGRTIPVSYQNLNLIKPGNLYIGGDIYNTNLRKGFSGIISKVTITNFDLNGEEIKNIYVQGPIDNLTSKLGLPAYGLRSPIYKIG